MANVIDRKTGLQRAADYEPKLVDWMNENALKQPLRCERNNVTNKYDIDAKIVDAATGETKCFIDFKQCYGDVPKFYFSSQNLQGWNPLIGRVEKGDHCALLLWNEKNKTVGIIKSQEKMRKLIDKKNADYCEKTYKGSHLWLSDYANSRKPAFKPELAGKPWMYYKSLEKEVFDEFYTGVEIG